MEERYDNLLLYCFLPSSGLSGLRELWESCHSSETGSVYSACPIVTVYNFNVENMFLFFTLAARVRSQINNCY